MCAMYIRLAPRMMVAKTAAAREFENLIHADTIMFANRAGMPSPNSAKALRQLFSQRWFQCVANDRSGAGGRSPGLWNECKTSPQKSLPQST
eukprot:jgi/Chrzof1/13120/Cz07g20180.t1